jgi:hypothetical protein
VIDGPGECPKFVVRKSRGQAEVARGTIEATILTLTQRDNVACRRAGTTLRYVPELFHNETDSIMQLRMVIIGPFPPPVLRKIKVALSAIAPAPIRLASLPVLPLNGHHDARCLGFAGYASRPMQD